MRSRILALLLLLAGPGFAQAACDPVIGVSNWNACSIATDGTLDCWGSDTYSLTTGAPAGTFTSLDGGDADMCAVKTDGSLSCWGSTTYELIAEVPAGTTYTYATPGTATACALKSDNSATCWGNNREACATNSDCTVITGTCSGGQCTGAYGWDAPASSFLQIAGDQDTYCGVKTDHSLECWGEDSGLGVLTEPSGTSFDFVDATAGHACAIKSDDSVDCWGDNSDGESTDPAGTFSDVAVVEDTSCGVKTDGSLSCWGGDGLGLLTDKPGSGTYTKIEGSSGVMCAVTTTGGVVCWGDDSATIVTESAGAECPVSATASYIVTFVGS